MPVPNTATVLPFAAITPRCAGGVDAARHATENDQSLRREIAVARRSAMPRAVGRGMAGADHRDAGLRERLHIATSHKDHGAGRRFLSAARDMRDRPETTI